MVNRKKYGQSDNLEPRIFSSSSYSKLYKDSSVEFEMMSIIKIFTTTKFSNKYFS